MWSACLLRDKMKTDFSDQRGKRRPAAVRFWEKVTKTDGCWLWTANTDPRGWCYI